MILTGEISYGQQLQMTAGNSTIRRRPPSATSGFSDGGVSMETVVSVDDVVRWAERRRVSSSKESRRNTLETVQSYMFRDPKRITRPQTCKDRRTVPKNRPLTAQSLCSEPLPQVTTPVAFPTDGSDSDHAQQEEEMMLQKARLSQQCCELLGPNVCGECAKKLRTYKQRMLYEHDFRNLHVSEENFTTVPLVKKNMPYLSVSQIQDRVAAGQVSRQQLSRLHEIRDSPVEIEKRRREREKREREALLNRRKPKSVYSLREMNRRLAEGDTGFRKKKQARLLVTESLFPSFISPRKVKYHEEPLFRVYYEPPLVAKHRQKSEPTFFAGSNFDYKLPDRLPDKIVFTKVERLEQKPKSRPSSPADPLDYEATFTDSVDNLIKEHLQRD